MLRFLQIIIYGLLLLLTTAVLAQDNYFFTLSTTKARPLAMGNAFTAVENDIISMTFNPASLSLFSSKKDYHFTAFFNPIAAGTIFYERLRSRSQADAQPFGIRESLATALLLVKGLAMTIKFIDVALLFNEQIINEPQLRRQQQFLDDDHLWDNSYHTLAVRMQLAERVAIGASGSYYRQQGDERLRHGLGFSYGVLIKPAPSLNVGLSFVDFPDGLTDARLPLERLVDQTMNIGIAFRPTPQTTIAFDLRNLTEDERKAVREAHFGVEQNLLSILALRAGFSQERFTALQTYSVGIGLVDSNLFFSSENKLDHPQWLLNYALIYQKNASSRLYWHSLSLLIRL
ncbi:MAG: hypothetical protein ONB16_06575 [candidate division KSB1 bacterium]|nr:hypothetical protein [candidate division KSB1 bacterium]MDZ7339795.1 hypothetical protein [candidate division KSB1 bacterium]